MFRVKPQGKHRLRKNNIGKWPTIYQSLSQKSTCFSRNTTKLLEMKRSPGPLQHFRVPEEGRVPPEGKDNFALSFPALFSPGLPAQTGGRCEGPPRAIKVPLQLHSFTSNATAHHRATPDSSTRTCVSFSPCISVWAWVHQFFVPCASSHRLPTWKQRKQTTPETNGTRWRFLFVYFCSLWNIKNLNVQNIIFNCQIIRNPQKCFNSFKNMLLSFRAFGYFWEKHSL